MSKSIEMKKSTLLLALFLFFSNLSLAQEIRVYKEPKFGFDWSQPSVYPDRIVISFGEDPSQEIRINWRTNTEITEAYAELALATAAPKFWRNATTQKAETEVLDSRNVAQAETVAHYHQASFSGLEPNTVYAYRVGDGERWSEWFQFKTASANPADRFSFLYVGDAQNYVLELWSRLIREGFKKAPEAEFIIHAGDLINYAHREQEWHEWFTAGGFIHSMLPTMPVPGNHEYNYLNQADREKRQRSLSVQWRPQFNLPLNGLKGLEETVYYMDYPNAKFIFLDSNRDQEIQAQWLEEVLEKNTKKWVIVTYHHPLFSASAGRDNEALRKLWKPIFDKYQVDLALQGHDHSYGRGRVAPGENVMDGLNMQDATGTVYVVSVSGGKMYNIKPDGWDEWGAVRDRAAENTQLFQVVSIEDNKLEFESYTAIGELYDKFDLVKNEDGINQFIEYKQNLDSEFRFDNTIPYVDQLPGLMEENLLKKYPGYSVEQVRFYEEEGNPRIRVTLKSSDQVKNLILDQEGRVISED